VVLEAPANNFLKKKFFFILSNKFMSHQSYILKQYFNKCQTFINIFSQFRQYIIDYDYLASRMLDINKMHKFFSQGYKLEREKYVFPEQNACAVWYSNPKRVIPRVFLSSYQNPIYDVNLDKNMFKQVVNHLNNPNDKMSYYVYHHIQKQNKYLAWTLLFQNNINTVALRVNNAEEFLYLLDKNNYSIHDHHNPIQTTVDKKIIQFATESDKVNYEFSSGTYEIPYAFVTIIERKIDPKTGLIREGFCNIEKTRK